MCGSLWRVYRLELGHGRRREPPSIATVLRVGWIVLVIRVDGDSHSIFGLGVMVTFIVMIMLIMMHLRVVNRSVVTNLIIVA